MQCASRFVVALCAMTLVGCGPTKQANQSDRPSSRDHSKCRLNVQETGATSGINSFTSGRLDLLEDAIIVVVNARNQFAHSLSMDELRRIWQSDSKITKWSDIRADWPARPLHLYAPGPGCGTFDQFGQMVYGDRSGFINRGCSRATSAALVTMLSRDPDALGFMGNLQFNKSKAVLRPLALGDGGVAVLPSPVTISDGSYLLNSKLYLHVNAPELSLVPRVAKVNCHQ